MLPRVNAEPSDERVEQRLGDLSRPLPIVVTTRLGDTLPVYKRLPEIDVTKVTHAVTTGTRVAANSASGDFRLS